MIKKFPNTNWAAVMIVIVFVIKMRRFKLFRSCIIFINLKDTLLFWYKHLISIKIN